MCDVPPAFTALNKFLISAEAATTIIDNACLTDFVQIPCATDQQSSSQVLSSATATGCTSKICGAAFSAKSAADAPAPVYSKYSGVMMKGTLKCQLCWINISNITAIGTCSKLSRVTL